MIDETTPVELSRWLGHDTMWATEDDLRKAVRNSLARCGCSFAELKRQHDTGSFESTRHSMAWVAIGDLEHLAETT